MGRMGVVNDSEFEKQKTQLGIIDVPIQTNEPKSEGEPVVIDLPNDSVKGRGKGNIEVPESLRSLIGQESITGGRESAIQLAKQFGLSESSVSAYSVGANSTASYDRRPGDDKIRGAKEHISKRARGKLLLALNKITSDKLDTIGPKELSSVAKDMSTIVRNMESDSTNSGQDTSQKGPTFVFYSPQLKKPEDFDVVSAKE